MPILKSTINSRSADFVGNANYMQEQVDDLYTLVEKIKQSGGAERQAKHKAKGKLLARERIEYLLDPGSPFLEIGQLAAHEVYPGEDVPAAGVIAGIGRVEGQECIIVA